MSSSGSCAAVARMGQTLAEAPLRHGLARLITMSDSTSARSIPAGEQFATVGELQLCYETFGDRTDPALVLIMGLGTQMIAWREDFCEQLAARGFFVVRFDNRDVGRSTTLDHLPVPTRMQL